MTDKHPVQDLVEPIIEDLGFEVVRIMTIGAKNPTLQIMIERKDRKDLIVDDCATVSRAISAVLDEKDPIEGEYSLEVSSPGLDRPLTKLEHFERFSGYEAKIETKKEVENRKRFKGKIISVDENQQIVFDMDGAEYRIPYETIGKAKLILTDELFNKYMESQADVELLTK
ncbi:MAG: ribosome maturation factor RimP [Alphaproteobacteria bacterium]|nr:ribosome maturation factor RimP [Alphaproteobacteria bacterium]